jgi:hypothetical protein
MGMAMRLRRSRAGSHQRRRGSFMKMENGKWKMEDANDKR